MPREINITNLLNRQMNKLQDSEINLSQMNDLVAHSIQLIIEEFFLKVAASFVIVVSSRSRRPLNLFLHLLEDLLLRVDMNVQLVVIDYRHPQVFEGSRRFNLLFVDSFEAFLDIDVISYTKNYDTSEFYHIFLMQTDSLINDDMTNIFTYCWNNQIINCNIQYQNAQGELHLYTYFPFGENICGNTQPQHINQFMTTDWMQRPYFIQKTKNFYGCPLMAAVRSVTPYVSVVNGSSPQQYEGFEVEMVKELSRILNFTLVFKQPWGDDRNYPTESGALAMVDFAFGYYRKHYSISHLYTNTNPHYQSTVLAVVCVRAHLFNTFQVLSYPFQLYTWFAIIGCIILALAITRIVHAHQPKSMSTFAMLSCAYGLPIKEKPRQCHSYFMFTPWLWCTFLLRSIYSDLLYHFFSNDIYLPMPKSLGDASNRSYGAVSNLFTAFDIQDIPYFQHKHQGIPEYIILNSTDDFIALQYLENHTDRNIYAITSEEFLMHYVGVNNKLSLFYIIPGIVMQEQLCIYFPKHTILAEEFDVVISNLQAIGYLLQWEKRLFDSSILSDLSGENMKMIKQQDLYGIYIICGGFHLIAIMIFALEMLSLKLSFLRIIFD
ncbi:uncharacterized protein LOC142231334 [Haematobia irritans]|uniref:uncharacterized protein LOC142231334 n=1 Tax=Haematobia irritans TaxID=7368 RepID=UPI003F508DE7